MGQWEYYMHTYFSVFNNHIVVALASYFENVYVIMYFCHFWHVMNQYGKATRSYSCDIEGVIKHATVLNSEWKYEYET